MCLHISRTLVSGEFEGEPFIAYQCDHCGMLLQDDTDEATEAPSPIDMTAYETALRRQLRQLFPDSQYETIAAGIEKLFRSAAR